MIITIKQTAHQCSRKRKGQYKDKGFYCARRERHNAAEITPNIFLLKVEVVGEHSSERLY
jgi:hypothetical protein